MTKSHTTGDKMQVFEFERDSEVAPGAGADIPLPRVDPVVVLSRAAVYLGLMLFTLSCWYGVFELVRWL